MIPAPCERAIAPPNARLPTFDTNSCSGAAGSSTGCCCSGARGFSCSWMRSGSLHAHLPSIRAGASSAQGLAPPAAILDRGAGTQEQQRRASILEIIGAWLHIWTPPRDADVPPVPWRKLAIGAGIGAVVLGVALAVMVPRINEGKESRAAQERAKDARAAAKNRARINHVQRPQHGDAAALLPAAGASSGRARGSRASGPARPHRGRHHGRRPRALGDAARSAPSTGPPRASARPARRPPARSASSTASPSRRRIKASKRNQGRHARAIRSAPSWTTATTPTPGAGSSRSRAR